MSTKKTSIEDSNTVALKDSADIAQQLLLLERVSSADEMVKIQNDLKNNIEKIKDSNLASKLKDIVQETDTGKMKELVGTGVDALKIQLQSLPNLDGKMSKIIENGNLSDLTENLKTYSENAGEVASTAIETAGDLASYGASDTSDKADAVSKIADGVSAASDKVGDVASGVSVASDKVGESAENIGNAADQVSEFADKTSNITGESGEAISAAADKISEGAEKAGEISEKVGDVADKVEGVSEKVGDVADTVSNVASGVSDVADKAANSLENVDEIAGKAVDVAKGAIEVVKELDGSVIISSITQVVSFVGDNAETIEQIGNSAAQALISSGIGLPLGIALLATVALLTVYTNNKMMKELIEKTIVILYYFQMIYNYVLSNLSIFITTVANSDIENKNDLLKNMNKYKINNVIISEIENTLSEIQAILNQIVPQDSKSSFAFKRLGQLKRTLMRGFQRKYYTERLVRNLTFLNSYMTIFLNQYDVVRANCERVIVRYANSSENKESHIYYQIYDTIEETPAYRRFIKDSEDSTVADIQKLYADTTKTDKNIQDLKEITGAEAKNDKLVQEKQTMLEQVSKQNEKASPEVTKGGTRRRRGNKGKGNKGKKANRKTKKLSYDDLYYY